MQRNHTKPTRTNKQVQENYRTSTQYTKLNLAFILALNNPIQNEIKKIPFAIT
jgi:hypothetical protein